MREHTELLAAHAKNIREGGAPHQQLMADAIEAVLGSIAPTVDVQHYEATIEQLKANVAGLFDERNAARDRVAELEAKLEDMKIVAGAAKHVPEESHVALRKKSKS